MAKKRKKNETHMVDMTARLQIKIVESTIEEEEELQRDLDEVSILVEQRMLEYEKNLQEMILAAISENIVNATQKDSDYFIEKYSKKFKGRNPDNIKNRIEQYELYLKRARK